MSPLTAANAAVHRGLNLAGATSGEDVEALQRAINRDLHNRDLDFARIKVDGELGPQTFRAAAFTAWVIGLRDRHVKQVRVGHAISEYVQRRIREPRHRTRWEHAREDHRKAELRAIRYRNTHGARAAVRWAEEQVGASENPPGSNTGPKIDEWTAFFGLHAVPWCGCFAGYAVKKVGGAAVTAWLPHAGMLGAAALAGEGGLSAVPFDEARPGDILDLWNGEHVALVRESPSGDTIKTVEGNTSAADGSQSDGGCVALKERSRSDVSVVARPNYGGVR